MSRKSIVNKLKKTPRGGRAWKGLKTQLGKLDAKNFQKRTGRSKGGPPVYKPVLSLSRLVL